MQKYTYLFNGSKFESSLILNKKLLLKTDRLPGDLINCKKLISVLTLDMFHYAHLFV